MNNYRNNRNRNNRYKSYSVHNRNRRNFRRPRYGRGAKRLDESLFIKHIDKTIKKVEYKAKNSFDGLNIDKTLKRNILKKGFSTPTPIQDQAIPVIMQNKDFVGIANTGTGKTVAFLLPAIQKVIQNRQHKVLIIAPTRELAGQINDELYSLCTELRLYSVLCTGGSSLYKQINNIRRGYHFIIGTPGRLKDLADRGEINYSEFTTVVLDEVDRMLDMGFINDIKYLIALLPKERQSLFFSATMDSKIEQVMKILLRGDYEKISVKTGETAENVEQDVIRVKAPHEKLPKLEQLLRTDDFKKVLVFVNTKRNVEKLCRNLRQSGHRAESIHGDRKQRQRQRAIDDFKRNKIDVLVATDVAARGIDVSGVSHVINYEAPTNYQDYIHRIGRTGRADQKGIALTFVERRR